MTVYQNPAACDLFEVIVAAFHRADMRFVWDDTTEDPRFVVMTEPEGRCRLELRPLHDTPGGPRGANVAVTHGVDRCRHQLGPIASMPDVLPRLKAACDLIEAGQR